MQKEDGRYFLSGISTEMPFSDDLQEIVNVAISLAQQADIGIDVLDTQQHYTIVFSEDPPQKTEVLRDFLEEKNIPLEKIPSDLWEEEYEIVGRDTPYLSFVGEDHYEEKPILLLDENGIQIYRVTGYGIGGIGSYDINEIRILIPDMVVAQQTQFGRTAYSNA